MSFISAGFFIVIAVTAIIYYLVPYKVRWYVLLIMSYAFLLTYGISCIGFLTFSILNTYVFTRIMDTCDSKRIRKRYLILAICLNFGILFFLKYCNFLIININSLFTVTGAGIHINKISLIMPLGISFYTFQNMSYLIDVYHRKYPCEKNIFKLALFSGFLPQILQGPIGRFDRLAPQLFGKVEFDIKNVEYGVQRIAWGLAKKLILADRGYVISNAIFSNLNVFSGVHIIVAMLMFSVYEYCDFSGGIDVVIGVAEIFGIKLDENFRQPYFSKSIGEFWRRWHITLGTWMKDYIFYPFSISKPVHRLSKKLQKKFGKTTGRVIPVCLSNILIFFIVGIWHGAAWRYIIYGLYNGIIIAASNLLKPVYGKMFEVTHINSESKVWGLVQVIRTFILVNIGWLFDGCATAGLAFKALGRIFVNFNMSVLSDKSLLKMGLNIRDWEVFGVALIILIIVSVLKEKGVKIRDKVSSMPLVLKWALYIILIFAPAPFGFVGSTTEFMYAQF